jgi:hypothetical protein
MVALPRGRRPSDVPLALIPNRRFDRMPHNFGRRYCCKLDNGRVVGYDNAHGYHHRHLMGHVAPIEFVSYEDVEERFELDYLAMREWT